MDFKQQLIVMLMLLLASSTPGDNHNYNLRPRTECDGHTKLSCTRLVFKMYNNVVSAYVDSDKSVCCPSGNSDEEMCDTCLDLSNRSLRNISVTVFNEWPNVRYIDMSYNAFNTLYSYMFSDTLALSHLNVSHNKLDKVENITFWQTTQLSVLDLSYNFLESLENTTFYKTPELSKLKLSHNTLKNFENCTFWKTGKLSHLDVSSNYLTYLDSYTFLTTTELQYLDLSNNNLSKINSAIFYTTIKLSHLDLSYNHLEYISEKHFFTLNKLSYLNLENNKLAVLENDRVFNSQENLSTFILSNNHLTDIDVKVVMPFKSIKYLDLSGNPFMCGNDFRATMRWCTEHNLACAATCMDSMSSTRTHFLNTEPVLMTSPSFTYPSEKKEEKSIDVEIIIGLVLLSLVLGCLITLAAIYCRRRLKNTPTEGREVIVDSAYNNKNENYYYESIRDPEERVTSFSTAPQLPLRPQQNNFPYKQDNVHPSGIFHQPPDIPTVDQHSEYRLRLPANPSNLLPKEVTVENDLYK